MMSNNSTSKIRVEFAGILGLPREPYAKLAGILNHQANALGPPTNNSV